MLRIVPQPAPYRCGKTKRSNPSSTTPAAVVRMVMTSPTRVNSQKVTLIFLFACCSTIRLATELNGVEFPARVLALAKASQMKWL